MRPNRRGFDEFFGHLTGGHRYLPEELTLKDETEVKAHNQAYRTKILRNTTRVEIDDYLTDEFSDEAVKFIENNSDNPFFLYLPYNAPHGPIQAPDEYVDRFPKIKNPLRKIYAGMISSMDDGVGKIIDKLKEFSFVIRKVLSKKVLVKFLPKLFFVNDDSFDYAEKIENLIRQTQK